MQGFSVTTVRGRLLYTASDGLPSELVQLLVCDREGAVWLGTGAGIARIADGKIEAFTPKEGFSSNVVLSILEDREGNLWLGTESGGVDILRDRTFTTYTAQDGISDDHIRSVYQDHAGTVWLGTSGGGLIVGIRTDLLRSVRPMDFRATWFSRLPARPMAISGWVRRTGWIACTRAR